MATTQLVDGAALMRRYGAVRFRGGQPCLRGAVVNALDFYSKDRPFESDRRDSAPLAQRTRAAGFYPACRGFESLAAHHAPLEEADELTWLSIRRLPVRARHGAHMAQWTNGESRRPFKPRHLRVRGPSALLRGGQAG